DPEAALEYAQGRPEHALRHQATQEVFDSWAHVDGPAMERWLAAQPANETTDQAWALLANDRFPGDPALAIATASRRGDDEGAGQVDSLFAFWVQKDVASARQWLKDTAMAEPLRFRLEELAVMVGRDHTPPEE